MKRLSVEEMLRESFKRHKLSNEQSLISFTTETNQVRQPLAPQLPHSFCFLLKDPIKMETVKQTAELLIMIAKGSNFVQGIDACQAKRIC